MCKSFIYLCEDDDGNRFLSCECKKKMYKKLLHGKWG